jgi:hypothetical protein
MANTLSRQILLPEFLKDYPHWNDFAYAIDEVFENTVDEPSNMLSRVREVLHLGLAAQLKILNERVLHEEDFERFEREILIKCLTFVGCPIQNYTIFSDAQLFRMLQHMPTYWYSKGGVNVGEFVSFVLGVDVDITNLWTQDYLNFYPEGSTAIGLPVYDGGEWYPTSHVRLGYDPFQLTDLTIPNLRKFLDDMLNYNLVLHSIESRSEFPVVQTSDNVVERSDFVDSKSVALSAYWISYLAISTDVNLEANFMITGAHTPQVLPPVEDDTAYVNVVNLTLQFSPSSRVVVNPNLPASTWSSPLSSTEVRITVANVSDSDLHNVVIPPLSIGDLFAGEVHREPLPGFTVPLIPAGGNYIYLISEVFFAFYTPNLTSYTLPVQLPARWVRTGDDPAFTNLNGVVSPLPLNINPPEQPCDPYFHQVKVLLPFNEVAGVTEFVDLAPSPQPILHPPIIRDGIHGLRFEGDAAQPIGVVLDVEETNWSAEFLLDLPDLPDAPLVYGIAYVGVEEALTNPSQKRLQVNVTPTGKVVLHLHDGVNQMNIESLNYVTRFAANHIMVQKTEDSWWLSVNGKMTPPFTKAMSGLSHRLWIGTGFTTTGLAALPRPTSGTLQGFRATGTPRHVADFFAPTYFPSVDCTDYNNSLDL